MIHGLPGQNGGGSTPGLLALLLLAATSAARAQPGIIHSVSSPDFNGGERANGLEDRPQLLGDRFVYRADDLNGQFYAVLPKPAVPLAGLRLRIAVRRDDSERPAVELETAGVTRRKAHFLLATARLPAGKYIASAALVDAAHGTAGPPVTFAFERSETRHPSTPFPAEGVPLLLPGQDELPEATWPARVGVPLPINAVPDAGALGLFEDGRRVPAQIRTRATWCPQGSAQWVHVDFLARYRDGKPAAYQLRLAEPREIGTPLACTADDEAITVDTGVVKFRVGRKAFAGVEAAWFDPSGSRRYDDAHAVIRGPGGPYLVDGRAIRFEARHDQQVEVAIEEQGPVRVTIVASGRYVNPEGRVEPPCLFRTRITAYAGQPLIRIAQHTILACDTRLVRLADVGFRVAVPEAQRFGFGADGQPYAGSLPPPGGPARDVYFHQDRHDHFRLVGARGGDVEGRRSDGWFSLAGGRREATSAAQVTVLLRDPWQKFPKEVGFERSGMTVHSWPAHGRRAFTHDEELSPANIYKFWCFHQGRLLDLVLPGDYFERLKAMPGTDECLPEHALNGNGEGLAIGNELALVFSEAGDTRVHRLARLFQEDPLASAPPEWNAGSGALGEVAAADRGRLAPVEDAVERGFLSYHRSVERGGDYGMWNYADSHTLWDVAEGNAGLHRVWQNSHYHQVGTSWLLFYRGGLPEMLRRARAGTDHYINVDTINFARPDDPAARIKFHVPGAMYHCKGLTHWGSEAYGMARRDTHAALFGHWTDPDAPLWAWYIDGNPRARDVYRMWSDSIRRQGFPLDGTRREANTALAHAITYYQATWDADSLPSIHGLGRSLRTVEPLEKQYPVALWHPLWINRYYGLTRDPAYVPLVLEYGRRDQMGNTWPLALGALAYELSGDRSYLELHAARVGEFARSYFRAPGDPYEWYGPGPGPLGTGWAEMTWGSYLKQLRAAGLDRMPPSEATPGMYPFTSAGSERLELPASLAVYALEPVDRPFRVTIRADSLGGDLKTTSVVVSTPSGRRPSITTEIGGPGSSSMRRTLDLPADGRSGLARVEFRGFEAAITGPVTDLPHEAVLLRAGTTYRTHRLLGFLQPLAPRPRVELVFSGASDRVPCDVIVTDAAGGLVSRASLFRPRPAARLALRPDPAAHPLPWKIDTVGPIELSLSGGGQTFLYAGSRSSLEAVRARLPAGPARKGP